MYSSTHISHFQPSGYLPLVSIADMNGDGRPDLIFELNNPVGGPPYGGLAFVGGVGVILDATPAGFELAASALSPSPVMAGDIATSTITVAPQFGFGGTVMLSCTGLPAAPVARLTLLLSPTVRELRS